MSEALKQTTTQVRPVSEQKEAPAWYDFIVKIVEDLLNWNMLTYKKEKAPRL